ncbi:MAG: FtsW/RodA/SpoVE family cell cycle protein [Mycoplasmatales bacterium]
MKHIDFRLLIPLVLLSFISIITQVALLDEVMAGYSKLIEHFLGIGLGFFIIYLVNKSGFNAIIKIAEYAYIVLYVLLVILIVVPDTSDILGFTLVMKLNGSKGWINLFGLYTVQPIEFMKVALIIKLAQINVYHQDSEQHLLKHLCIDYLKYAIIPVGLVFLQPDLGGALLLGFITLIMFLFAIKDHILFKRIIFIGSILLIVGTFLITTDVSREFLINYTPIQEYQMSRFDSWLRPYTSTNGYQLQQSLITIGSVGLIGDGFHSNLVRISEIETDFVFAGLVGHFGWLLGLLTIGLFLYLMYVFVDIAHKVQSNIYKHITIGIFAMFFLQVFENIGMTIGVTPVTGIVLPFISMGMTAQISFYTAIALVFAISQMERNVFGGFD